MRTGHEVLSTVDRSMLRFSDYARTTRLTADSTESDSLWRSPLIRF